MQEAHTRKQGKAIVDDMRHLKAHSRICRSDGSSKRLSVLGATMILSMSGCEKPPPPSLPPPLVKVMDVTGSAAALHAEVIGQLDSPQNVEIRARVEAFVDKMPFTEGTE